jgi:hypothetical protein
MRQLLLNRGTGATSLIDAPMPSLQPGHVLIRTERTLISAGTERMLIDFGHASMLDRARQQPEKVRLLLGKMRTDGVTAAINAVRSQLDHPLPPRLLQCGDGDRGGSGRGCVQSRGPGSFEWQPRRDCERAEESVCRYPRECSR